MPAPYTKQDLLKWLKKQPKNRTFDNGSGYRCVGHCFLAAKGAKEDYHSLREVTNAFDGNWFMQTIFPANKKLVTINDHIEALQPLIQ